MDPLSLLREYATRGELDKLVRVNGEFRFGTQYSFPCTARTAYRSKHGDFYTLETLVHYLQHAHLKHTEYLQTARAASVPTITFLDRKPLLDYLTGKLSSSDSVVFPLPNQPQIPNPNLNINLDFPPIASDFGVYSKQVEDNDKNRDGDVGGAGGGGGDVAFGNGVKGDDDYVSIIRANERPLKDREGLLECRNRDFYSVLVGAMKREEERQKIESQQRKDGLVAKSRLMGADGGIGFSGGGGDEMGFESGLGKSKLKGGKLGEGVPIILVPSASQTLITIYNVKEFLEDGVFIPTDVKVKQMKGPKPECVTVQKKFSTDRNRVVSAYEVRDKPSALKSEDWDRVVAVFVLGKEWQFKEWPFKDHVEIFNKSK